MAKGVLAGEPVAVMKPLTYMNASGEAVGAWIRWNRLTVADLVVVSSAGCGSASAEAAGGTRGWLRWSCMPGRMRLCVCGWA